MTQGSVVLDFPGATTDSRRSALCHHFVTEWVAFELLGADINLQWLKRLASSGLGYSARKIKVERRRR